MTDIEKQERLAGSLQSQNCINSFLIYLHLVHNAY